MKAMAKSGEDYFISPRDAIVVVSSRIYSLYSGIPAVVESDHVTEIEKILKGEGDVAASQDAAADSAPSDAAPRLYRRKSSEA